MKSRNAVGGSGDKYRFDRLFSVSLCFVIVALLSFSRLAVIAFILEKIR
ncbi:MAG: hypothetical protein ACLP2U_18650 [Syntrophobacteraceae bacterium]